MADPSQTATDRLETLYPDVVRATVQPWHDRAQWPLLDAVAWVATKSDAVAELLAVHRHFAVRGGNVAESPVGSSGPVLPYVSFPRCSPDNAERQCLTVLKEVVGDNGRLLESLRAIKRTLGKETDKGLTYGIAPGGGPPVEIGAAAWSACRVHTGGDRVDNLKSIDGQQWFSDVTVSRDWLMAAWPRIAKAKGKGGRKPKYDWPAFHDRALSLLAQNGGLDMPDDYSQADCEREMADWCYQEWRTADGKQPAESEIRKYLKKAERAYIAAKANN